MSARSAARATALAVLAACVLLGIGAGLYRDGYRMYIIHTGSMEPTLMPGTLVIDKPVAQGTLKPGEIITFRHSDLTTDVVTHRFTHYTSTGLIDTKGDANATADPWDIRPNQVKGAVALDVPKLGYLVVFLKQPAGIGAVVAMLFGLIFLWGIFFPAAITKVFKPSHRNRQGSVPAAVLLANLGSDSPSNIESVSGRPQRPMDGRHRIDFPVAADYDAQLDTQVFERLTIPVAADHGRHASVAYADFDDADHSAFDALNDFFDQDVYGTELVDSRR